jgi:hypothetical protein
LENSSPYLAVTSFGGFSIAARAAETEVGVPVIADSLGHSRKLWAFLEYLIFSGKDKGVCRGAHRTALARGGQAPPIP